MSRVFVSYSRQNGREVNLLARKLEDAGHKVWLDRSAIQGGARWQEEIVRGIEKANVFVIVLSPQSIESENVERELGLARVTAKRILPVMLQRVSVPQKMQYALGSLEIIDISAEDIGTACQRVVQAIAAPDARTGIVYLDAPWRDKLRAYAFHVGYISLLGVGVFQDQFHTKWAVPIAFLILVALLLAIWLAAALRRICINARLKTSGIVLSTQLKGFTNFRGRGRIVSEWWDPETGNRHEFFSKAASLNRLEFVKRTVSVVVDPGNFKIYRLDLPLPSLPKEASGSLALCESHELEDDRRQLPGTGEDARVIFLSHSEPDSGSAALLVQKLEAAGYTVWRPGPTNENDASYEEQVIDGINGARIYVLLLSPDSIQSPGVRGELDMAVAKGKRIVTAVIRRTTVPEEVNYALASVHHVDLSEDFGTGVTRLLDAITAQTERVTVVPESAAPSRVARLRSKLRPVLRVIGFPVFMPLIAVGLVLTFLSMVLQVKHRPAKLEARIRGWLGFWDEEEMQASDLWLGLGTKQSLSSFHDCKDRGRLLATEYCSFEARTDDRGRRRAIRILSLWRDPISHERYRFRSNWLACEPEHIKTKIIPVYVDPENLRRYSVDLSFLPPDQRREVPKEAPFLRRLRNWVLWAGDRIDQQAPKTTSLERESEQVENNRVFVSSSSENVDKANVLIEQLERAGYEVVNRSETAANRSDGQQREEAISLAGTFLIIVPPAKASDFASMLQELRHAYTLSKRIIPVTFNDSEIPPSMQLSLAGVQRVDLSHDIESGMPGLMNALPSRKSDAVLSPDSPIEVSRPLSGSPLHRLFSTAIMGGFSWILGLTMSVMWLDRGSTTGVMRVAVPVVFVYGCTIGVIFYKRTVHMGKLFWAAFVSLVLTPVAVALFSPGRAIDSHRDSLALMLTPVLGNAAFLASKIIYRAVFNHRLKTRGKLVLTEYKGSGMSQWRDPVTDEVHTFVRDRSGIPSKPLRATTIAVFVDPANPSDYYMDFSYSSQSKGPKVDR